MQDVINRTVEPSNWPTPEEQVVTFQIALVGCDGLVIGSDRRAQYARMGSDNKPQLSQVVNQQKFFTSDSRSLICFAAGGNMAPNLARQIAQECDPANALKGVTESDWELRLHQIARTAMLPYQYPIDELLVARSDRPNAFWMVSRKLVGQNIIFASVQKMREHYSIGSSTVAQFLPRHLWTQGQPISELKKLALLTLSYAAEEEPSSIGPPFDIVTLDNNGTMVFTVHKPIHANFQAGLEHLLKGQ